MSINRDRMSDVSVRNCCRIRRTAFRWDEVLGTHTGCLQSEIKAGSRFRELAACRKTEIDKA